MYSIVYSLYSIPKIYYLLIVGRKYLGFLYAAHFKLDLGSLKLKYKSFILATNS